jgi:hypothetical protein
VSLIDPATATLLARCFHGLFRVHGLMLRWSSSFSRLLSIFVACSGPNGQRESEGRNLNCLDRASSGPPSRILRRRAVCCRRFGDGLIRNDLRDGTLEEIDVSRSQPAFRQRRKRRPIRHPGPRTEEEMAKMVINDDDDDLLSVVGASCRGTARSSTGCSTPPSTADRRSAFFCVTSCCCRNGAHEDTERNDSSQLSF